MPRVFEKQTLDSGVGQDNARCNLYMQDSSVLTSNVPRMKVNDRVINE